MNCSIEFSLNGQRGRVEVEAEDSISALLRWLESVPPSAGIKAIVKVLMPVEVA